MFLPRRKEKGRYILVNIGAIGTIFFLLLPRSPNSEPKLSFLHKFLSSLLIIFSHLFIVSSVYPSSFLSSFLISFDPFLPFFILPSFPPFFFYFFLIPFLPTFLSFVFFLPSFFHPLTVSYMTFLRNIFHTNRIHNEAVHRRFVLEGYQDTTGETSAQYRVHGGKERSLWK